MSTEQTGVNAPTSEEPTPDEHAPRGSRRAIRQAERAAEREAILTGQQPLLTRREMRRLREEAKALRAAVEAGEITPEQAQALQDPLADPASVTSRSSAPSGDDAGNGLERVVIGARVDRPPGGDQPHLAVAGHSGRGTCRRVDDLDDRDSSSQGVALPRVVQDGRRGGVAGDDEQLDPSVHELVHDA